MVSYLKFAKLKRKESWGEMESILNEIGERSLADHSSIYTLDDVKTLLNEVTQTIKGTLENELVVHSHTSALLMQQYLSQAETFGLSLQSNISELENRYDTAERR